MQAGVYELIRDDGTPDPTKVLKAKHKYALLTKMQREWEVGRRISSLTDPDQSLPGFMSVGPAVCTAKGNFKGTQQSLVSSEWPLVSRVCELLQHYPN